ncbi:MAG: EamA family transporter [Candidatus Daviesbacteria bacterium]
MLKILKAVPAKLTLPNLGIGKAVLAKSWPYLAVLVAHIIWGSNFVVAKLTLQEIPPMSLAFLRFALAILLLSPFLILEKKIKIDKNDLPKLLAIGVLMAVLNIAFFYFGLERTTVTSASILTLIIPLISVLGGWWFLKEKIYVVNLAGIIIGFIGALLVFGIPLIILGIKTSSEAIFGNILIILASISWVAGAILSKNMAKKYSTLIITAVVFSVGAIAFLLPALSEFVQNPKWISQVTYIGVLGVLFITIASSISAYFLFEWGLAKIGVIKADLFQYIEPIIAIAMGVLILSESIDFGFVIGGALIALGVYWGTVAKEQHRHHKAHRT